MRLQLSLLLVVFGLALAPAAALGAPGNDDYTNAEFLAVDDAVSGSNVDATVAGGEPLTCGTATMEATVWYLVPGTGGRVTLNTDGSEPDTVLAVYDTDGSGDADNPPPSAANAIDCNDDILPASPGSPGANLQSELVFNTVAGLDYLVQIGSCCGSSPPTGGIELLALSPPSNDTRGAARAIAAGPGVLVDNFGATTDPGERVDCAGDPYGKTVWFRFNAPQSGRAVFTTGGGFDAVMAVYRGTTFLGCNDDGVSGAFGPSRVALHLDAGDYLIQVGGWGDGIRAAWDQFSIQVDFVGDPPPRPPDRDGDGIPDPSDRCPDQSSRARDADSDGCLDPEPPPPLKSLRSTVSIRWLPPRRATRLSVLTAKVLPKGATVKVTCKSKPRRRCPRSRTYRITKATKKLNLRKPFGRRKLPAGTTLTITITAPGYEGKVWRYRMRRNKPPKTSQLCLQPGAKRPGSCL